jgi:predicted dehydrogenase
MTDRLRWGLLSTARINRSVIPPLRASSRNELAAVASRSRERAEAYAREWHIPQAFGSYEALLAAPDIHAIYISLPNDQHAAWCIRCAEAGKHVLCEKPLALSVPEVEQIMAAARRHGTHIAEAFMYRHHPQTLKVRGMVAEGAIGAIRSLNGCFSFYLQGGTNVRWNPEQGGGSLWDVGCYPVSYARFVLGQEPVEVFGWQALTERGVDHTFAGALRFPGDVLAAFDSSFQSPYRRRMEIVGERGTIFLDNPFKPNLDDVIRLTRGGEVEVLPAPPMSLYAGEFEDMAAAVLDGKPQRIPLEDSLANTRALVALYESARMGRPVHL